MNKFETRRIIYREKNHTLERYTDKRIKIRGERHECDSFHLDTVLDLQSAIDKLDNEQRAANMLIGVEGYSYAEAAAVLEVPPGTVASRVARARTKLGELLFNRQGKSFRFKSVNTLRKENEP